MSAVAVLEPTTGDDQPGISLSVLQDILYDIVATGGADAVVDVPVDEVERFLHEHARDTKSEADFVAFFAQHGLPTHVTPTVVGLNAPAPLPASQAPAAAPRPPAPITTAPGSVAMATPPPPPPPIAHQRAAARQSGAFRVEGTRSRGVLWALLVVIAVLLGGLLGLGFELYQSMRAELRETRDLGAAQQRFIEQLDGRTSHLQADVSRNGALIEHVDSRSELLVDSLLPAPLARPAVAPTE